MGNDCFWLTRGVSMLEEEVIFLLQEGIQKEGFSDLWKCRNPTLAKCGGEAQHLEKVSIWSPPRLPNV
jgi:hypothetical protein